MGCAPEYHAQNSSKLIDPEPSRSMLFIATVSCRAVIGMHSSRSNNLNSLRSISPDELECIQAREVSTIINERTHGHKQLEERTRAINVEQLEGNTEVV
jgi:hypothetical protein